MAKEKVFICFGRRKSSVSTQRPSEMIHEKGGGGGWKERTFFAES